MQDIAGFLHDEAAAQWLTGVSNTSAPVTICGPRSKKCSSSHHCVMGFLRRIANRDTREPLLAFALRIGG